MKVVALKPENNERTIFRVYGKDKLPFPLINKYLRFLENKGSAPNTVRAYSFDLIRYFEYLDKVGKTWENVVVDDWAGFVHYLKYATRDPEFAILPVNNQQSRVGSTINRALAAINAFYKYQYAINEIEIPNIAEFLSNPYTNNYKHLLSFANKSRPRSVVRATKSVGRQKIIDPIPKEVSADTQRKLVKACCNKRDRLLLLLLIETGMRIGQVLQLRHSDIESWQKRIVIEYRLDNPNDVYAKSIAPYHVDISDDWLNLYTDFLITDLAEIDSDFVFTNLYCHSGDKEFPMTYPAALDLFKRLSKKVNAKVTPHLLRHTHATELLRAGMSIEIVAKRLGHRSIDTTKKIYEHLNAEDMKNELKRHTSRSNFLRSIYSFDRV